jgi:hypothetical protein
METTKMNEALPHDFEVYRDENGLLVQSQASKERVAAYKAQLPFVVQEHYGAANLLDVFPTEHPGVWRGEWTTSICHESIIDTVYLCVSNQFHGSGVTQSIFHADTIQKCLNQLAFEMEAGEKFERIKEMWQRCSEITRPMVRALGWCDPGINGWVRENAQDVIVGDRIKVRDLYKVCLAIVAKGYYDSYAKTLLDLLKDNKHIKEIEQ